MLCEFIMEMWGLRYLDWCCTHSLSFLLFLRGCRDVPDGRDRPEPSHLGTQGVLLISALWEKGMIPINNDSWVFFSEFKTCTTTDVCFFTGLTTYSYCGFIWQLKNRVKIPELHSVTENRIWLLCLKGLFHNFFHLMIPVSKRNPCGSGTWAHMGSASLWLTPPSVLASGKINGCVTGGWLMSCHKCSRLKLSLYLC